MMTFQDASGLSVWCGRGVRSGKKRDLRFVGDDAFLEKVEDERAFDIFDDWRRLVGGGGIGLSGDGANVSVTDELVGSSVSGTALSAVNKSKSGNPDVAPAHQFGPAFVAPHPACHQAPR